MLTPEQIQENKQRFIDLLMETERPGVDKVIEWLMSTDFFEAPASTRFHLNYEGGLLRHSLNVWSVMRDLSCNLHTELTGKPIPRDTAIITALLHDVCKANTYKKALKWRKDANNKWEQYEVQEFKEDEPLGHGEKSVFLLQRCGLQLTESEIYMIRWHMGGFDECNRATLSAAMAKFPEIALIHSADLIASNILENESVEKKKND